jgi:hypothetical protein
MQWIIGIFGLLSLIGSIAAVASVRSDIQIIIVIVLFLFGITLLGLASALGKLDNLLSVARQGRGSKESDAPAALAPQPTSKAPRQPPAPGLRGVEERLLGPRDADH